MSDNKQNPKEVHEAKAQTEGAGGASQPPAHGAKKPLTREEYNKLPTRVKRKLGTLKPPIDRLSATPDNFKLFLRDIKELYYVVDNYCMLLPKVEKYSQAGVAAVVMQNMNELLDLAARVAQYDPSINREEFLREIAAKLFTLEVKIKMSSRSNCFTQKRRHNVANRIIELWSHATALAMSQQNINVAKQRKEQGNKEQPNQSADKSES